MSRYRWFLCMLLFCLLSQFFVACDNPPPPLSTVTIDPTTSYPFEGWGTSLAWWAETIGSWKNAEERSALEDTLFNVDNGLGSNVIRYNFGANADDNQCSRKFRSYGNIDSFEPSNGKWDWTKDQAQLTVLKEAQTIIGKSHTSAIFEGFANSAPAWVLKSHCTQGNWGANNLKSADEQNYAQYLATIVQHFHADPNYGNIIFRTVDPFNEPDLPWSGDQEGMYVDLKQQEAIISDLHTALPTYTSISAPDDNNISRTICSYNNSPGCTYYQDQEPYNAVIQNDIYQLNTHNYNGNDDDRVGFSSFKHRPERQSKPAWMSEYTTTGTDNLGPKCSISADRAMLGALHLSCQFSHDIILMHPTTWVYWQAVDGSGFGLLQTSNGNLATESFDMTKQYYALWQYSHFIRPGDQIIESGLNGDSLAAINPMSHTLVIVTTNMQSTDKKVTYDLSNFSSTSGSVAAYTTSAETSSPTCSSLTLHRKQFSTTLPRASITTFVIPTTPTHTVCSDLTTVDWNNFTYSSLYYGNTQPFHARDGKAINNGILFQIYTPTYGDLPGDAQSEAAIPYGCTGADFGGGQVLVYSRNAMHPQLLGQLPLPDPSGRATITDVQSVTIKNDMILLTGRGYSETAAHCCPDLHIESSYRWNGSQFVILNSNVTRLEAGHVLVVKTDTPIMDAQGNPIASRCQGPHNDIGAIVSAGWSVVALRDSPVPQLGSKEKVYVAYPDPCQLGNDFSHNDTIANGSGAVGYVAFSDLAQMRQVKPHLAFPTSRGTAWRDCWGPTTCGDAMYPNENGILTSSDPVLYAWWTGS